MAKITAPSPNTTITTGQFGIPVANELNQRCLKIDGVNSDTGAEMQMTGDLLLANRSPTNANHATRKKYVDDLQAAKLNLAGGTMTGALSINEQDSTHCLALRSQAKTTGGAFSNSPYMSFYDATATTRYGYLQGSPAGINLVAGFGQVYVASGANGDIVLNSGGAQVRTSDAIYCVGGGRFFAAAGSQVQLVGTSSRAYMAFYGNGSSVDSVGVRQGYVGYPDSGHLYIKNEVASASIVHQTAYGHTFSCANNEVARIVPSVMMVGKTNAGFSYQGVSLFETGTIYATQASPAVPVSINVLNAVDGNWHLQVARNGTTVGRIEQEGTTGSKFVSGSDRRMKNILGPITDSIERIKAMNPYRVSWKADPTRGTTDAFIADEMMDIVPEAVSGLPDAVTGPPVNEWDPPEGTPQMQGMSYEKLVTVTIAALQNIIGRVEALEAS